MQLGHSLSHFFAYLYPLPTTTGFIVVHVYICISPINGSTNIINLQAIRKNPWYNPHTVQRNPLNHPLKDSMFGQRVCLSPNFASCRGNTTPDPPHTESNWSSPFFYTGSDIVEDGFVLKPPSKLEANTLLFVNVHPKNMINSQLSPPP